MTSLSGILARQVTGGNGDLLNQLNLTGSANTGDSENLVSGKELARQHSNLVQVHYPNESLPDGFPPASWMQNPIDGGIPEIPRFALDSQHPESFPIIRPTSSGEIRMPNMYLLNHGEHSFYRVGPRFNYICWRKREFGSKVIEIFKDADAKNVKLTRFPL